MKSKKGAKTENPEKDKRPIALGENSQANLTESIIASEFVFRGKFLQIVRDLVKTPQGGKSYREYILHPGASLIIPLLPNGNTLMIEQYRHAMRQVFLEFPAGKLDKGEDPLTAAKRELQEETGYAAETWTHLTHIHPVIGYANERIDIFLASGLTFTQAKLDHDEMLLCREVSLPELLHLVRSSQVTDVKTQIAAFWLEKWHKGEWQK